MRSGEVTVQCGYHLDDVLATGQRGKRILTIEEILLDLGKEKR